MYFIGVDLKKIDECVGDPEADVENQVLKAEQDAQVRLVKNYLFTVHTHTHTYISSLILRLSSIRLYIICLVSDWQRLPRRCDYTANSCDKQ